MKKNIFFHEKKILLVMKIILSLPLFRLIEHRVEQYKVH